MKFRRISDELVEAIDDAGTSVTITLDDAIQLGYIEFTYKGKKVTIVDFAQSVNISYNSVLSVIHKFGFSTGEDIIAYFANDNRIKCPITYQNKQVSISEFAELIDKKEATVRAIINKHNYKTGEEVIEHYNNLSNNKKLTYKGIPISVPDFAKLIGKNRHSIKTIVRTNNFSTGEEILAYLSKPKLEDGRVLGKHIRTITYNGKVMAVIEFGRLIGKNDVGYLIDRYGYTSGEQIIEHYNNKPLTYKNEPISITDFSKIINRSAGCVTDIMNKYKLKTGEDIIAQIQKFDNKKFHYMGKSMTHKEFADLIGVNIYKVRYIIYKYKCKTGEEVKQYLN